MGLANAVEENVIYKVKWSEFILARTYVDCQ
jgi:hypothetical protein